MHDSPKHEFAIYIDQLSQFVRSIAPGGMLILEGDVIYHRMIRVLRLSFGDTCILFDQEVHVRFVLEELQNKRRIHGIVHSKQPNTVLFPTITVLLPLLKRDDCDAALYTLTELGVNEIRLVKTQKVRRTLGGESEFDRLRRVMISASEQSKNFAFPNLYRPVSLKTAIKTGAKKNIYFDTAGEPLVDLVRILDQDCPEHVALMVGPEGDLLQSEKDVLKKAGFMFYALTPTILRSVHAAALAAGVVRSILSTPPKTHQRIFRFK